MLEGIYHFWFYFPVVMVVMQFGGGLLARSIKYAGSATPARLCLPAAGQCVAHAAGRMIHTGLQRRRSELRETLTTVEGSDTATAARLARGLRVEILSTDAELAETSARQDYLSAWLAQNGGTP